MADRVFNEKWQKERALNEKKWQKERTLNQIKKQKHRERRGGRKGSTDHGKSHGEGKENARRGFSSGSGSHIEGKWHSGEGNGGPQTSWGEI